MSKVIKSSGNIHISANNTVFIDGSLTVTGTTTSVNTTNTDVLDNVLTLNKGESGAGVSLGVSGIDIDRGSSAHVGLRWNEGSGYWELTNNGTTWQQITTGAGSSGIHAVVDDTDPHLGGNLILNGKNITGTGNVNITGSVTATGNLTSNGAVLYGSTVSSGGTGIYITNGSVSNQELISKKKAITYSIIFG